MNIKSLLIGSAAALVAVSGARAADAIVAAEPEPVEYVRVCDAFGTGFFYIPGTETCLRIGGYVRYDISGGELLDRISATGDETYGKRARFSFQTSTASETELGTLRTFAEIRFQWDTNDAAGGYTNDSEFSVNFAWLQLGGLRIGKDESLFTTFTGYGGNVIEDTLAGGYGPFDTTLISYTYSAGAFTAALSLEQGDDSTYIPGVPGVDAIPGVPGDPIDGGMAAIPAVPAVDPSYSGWGIDDYMPHVVIGLGYNAGNFNIRATGAYDTRDDITDIVGGLNERGGFAGKVRVDYTINDAASIFAMLMYGENSSAYTTWANGAADDETFSVIAGASVGLSEKAVFNFQGQWVEGAPGLDDEWSAVANVAYTLVPGLTITPEIAYYDNGIDDAFGGTLRFERSF